MVCRIANGTVLTREESREAYRQVILNEQPELQQGAFLMAHITRGPTKEELAGAWEALDLYDTAKIHFDHDGPVCDIVGTGSDQLKTVNCSTPAALIAAACGLKVAKKGARLVTGVSGASDILEQLGLDLDAPLKNAEKSLRDNGICYLPGEAFLTQGWGRLIQSMRFTSAFNIIGPLTRPCPSTNRIVIGAYSPKVCDQLIDVLDGIGMEAALSPFGMVDGGDPARGMDEFSICGTTRVVELRKGVIETHEVRPTDFGIPCRPFDTIASRRNAKDNAQLMQDTLRSKHDSSEADFFCVNAAAALRIAGLCATYAKGFDTAKTALHTGKPFELLQRMIDTQGRRGTHR